jgi:molecular chaperone GrpE
MATHDASSHKHEKVNKENHEIDENSPDLDAQHMEEIAQEVADIPDFPAIIADLNDKLLRSAAEMQNLQRRTAIDMQKAKYFSIENFARDLLGVMDNLCRASESISDEDAKNNEKLKSVKEGVEITKKELANVFERNHIKRVGEVGDKFDPNLHQAMMQVEDKEKPAGTIIDVMMPGYMIKERLLRPAMVAVTK